MYINELETNRDNRFTDIQCVMAFEQSIISKDGSVEMVGRNRFSFISKDNIIEFTINDKNSDIIAEMFNRHYFCLARVTCYGNNTDKRVFFLDMAFFYYFTRFGITPVVLTEEIKEKIKKDYIRGKKTEDDVLTDNFRLTDGNNDYFAFTVGKYNTYEKSSDDSNFAARSDTTENPDSGKQTADTAEATDAEAPDSGKQADDTAEATDAEAPDSGKQTADTAEATDAEASDSGEQIGDINETPTDTAEENPDSNAMVIYGRDFYFYAVKAGEKFEEKLYVKRMGKIGRNPPKLRIALGKLEFTDKRAILSEKVARALDSTKGYLDLWDQYDEQGGALLLERVRTVGLISVDRAGAGPVEGGIHLPYSGLDDKAKKLLSGDAYLWFSDEIPEYLADPLMTWTKYIDNSGGDSKNTRKGTAVRIKEMRDGGFVLDRDWQEQLPEGQYVSLSIIGDEKQIRRRYDARQRIATGKAANPALGLILEGKLTEELGGDASKSKHPPLSAFVKEKIFKHDPTETQKRAIEIALNTPDIAIIQGPPGTGKTTVITAIIERLNELYGNNTNYGGQVLITSFQHDAVRNVIGRLRINSLPTIKFGKQERAGEEDMTKEQEVEKWCEEYIRQLKAMHPELSETEKQKRLTELHNIYLLYPGDNNALNFLRYAKEINLDNRLDQKIEMLIQAKSKTDTSGSSDLLRLARRIRTTREGFKDDGADNADILLAALEDMDIDDSIPENKRALEVLDKAACCFGEPDEALLASLGEVRSYLLLKCSPKPTYKKEYPDAAVSEIYKELNSICKRPTDEKTAILDELLMKLRTNRAEVERSLERYLFVYAATTQQSEGKDIKRAKGITGNSEHPEYDTVIVDEAARVSPTDLMVPLAQAKKRIILVGDHRQLPHIFDEEVFESLKENGETVDIGNIKKSMFEYLLEKARELEKIDHIDRTIVLDAQYRMHPVLGNFVNEVFYMPHSEYFASPLPAENYAQSLSKKSFPVQWYNFPDTCGKERKSGTSRIRDCEAAFIAKKIKEYINSPSGKDLSYGVITFYSEQVKLIRKMLNDELCKEEIKRVHVGSVDAFQGMEFDVIFLSVVRSSGKNPTVRVDRNSEPAEASYDYLELYKNSDSVSRDADIAEYKEWESYKDKVGMQNYGFLISENRLCVSLSRQKRLLIVVGNADMFRGKKWGRVADICVPGMKRLYDLCNSEGVVYNGNS